MRTIKSKWYSVLAACALTGLLAACNTVPPTNVHQPMSARPAPQAKAQALPGAIYAASYTAPLFENKRARNVGDTLTIQINENTNAATKGNTKTARTQSNSLSVPTLYGLPGKSFLNASLQTNSANSFDGSGPEQCRRHL